MPTPKFTAEILAAAIEGFEQQKSRINAQIAELKSMMSGGANAPTTKEPTTPTSEPNKPARKKMSAAARKRIGEGVRKAALVKKGAGSQPKAVTATVTRPAKKAKRTISAEGLRRIVEANKKRWALKKAEAAKATPAVAKRAVAKKP